VDIEINVGPESSVEIVISDNRGNQIILLHAMWEIFIERHANIEQVLQSPALSSLAIQQNLTVELVKIHDVNIVKLKSRDACLYMKSSIVCSFFCLN